MYLHLVRLLKFPRFQRTRQRLSCLLFFHM